MQSMPSSILHAQVPTASGLTALAHCSRYASFVGLGLIITHAFLLFLLDCYLPFGLFYATLKVRYAFPFLAWDAQEIRPPG